MQKGKVLYSGWRRFLTAALPALLIGQWFSQVRASVLSPVWDSGTRSISRPPGYYPFIPGLERDFFALAVSCSNPYSLDGLIATRTDLIRGRKKYTLAGWWGMLRHPLYREDRLGIRAGLMLPEGGLGVAAEPIMSRRRTSGFESSISLRSDITMSIAFYDFLSYWVHIPVTIAGYGGTDKTVMGVSIKSGGTEVAFNIRAGKIGEQLTKGSATVELSDRILILSGINFETDELSGGLIVRCDGIFAGLSYGSHPVLGSTYHVGIGRLWK